MQHLMPLRKKYFDPSLVKLPIDININTYEWEKKTFERTNDRAFYNAKFSAMHASFVQVLEKIYMLWNRMSILNSWCELINSLKAKMSLHYDFHQVRQ